jgi:hypothetical protein
MPNEGETQRRIPNISPNKSSVVLWVAAGAQSALLGADLEHSARAEEGWLAVLNAREMERKADIFKVPHHGSPNADCPEVWRALLNPSPIAVITPFSSGKRLPQAADLKRILERTPDLYCTAGSGRKPPRRDPTVEKAVRDIQRYAVDGRPGHVRIRAPLDGTAPASVELFHGVFKVDNSVVEEWK